ncbi:MAG TPA: acyl carrier protein [Candidatus Blautia faecavium]|uniref:Acyl carrier protein n=1 Tax=Candidatus Blautia faecavium TaxID=2838487 RepID=A0A9D2LS92_9FIRM|nr:acyl carrier protein [Candidatus Blautia faecavium]
MREDLMEILTELRPEVDFATETQLIDDGILDSFDLVSLIGEINDSFDVEISFDDIEPENFNSVEAMEKLIQKLQGEE